MIADNQIRERLARYLSGEISLDHFEDWLVEVSWNMHRDSDEKSDAPVVSLSLGDTCLFRFGNTTTRTRPYTDVELRSGDLFVFGGPARMAYHGITRWQVDLSGLLLRLLARLGLAWDLKLPASAAVERALERAA